MVLFSITKFKYKIYASSSFVAWLQYSFKVFFLFRFAVTLNLVYVLAMKMTNLMIYSAHKTPTILSQQQDITKFTTLNVIWTESYINFCFLNRDWINSNGIQFSTWIESNRKVRNHVVKLEIFRMFVVFFFIQLENVFFFRLTIKMSTLENLLVYHEIIKANCMKIRFWLNNTGDGRRWRSRFKIASIITISPGTGLYSILCFDSLLLLLLFTFT